MAMKTPPKNRFYTAAKAAYVDDFVRKMPDGYNTVLNEEASNISQGQRQLITIARAFISNPDILILDEATSNVDSRTEMLIQKAMRRLLKETYQLCCSTQAYLPFTMPTRSSS